MTDPVSALHIDRPQFVVHQPGTLSNITLVLAWFKFAYATQLYGSPATDEAALRRFRQGLSMATEAQESALKGCQAIFKDEPRSAVDDLLMITNLIHVSETIFGKLEKSPPSVRYIVQSDDGSLAVGFTPDEVMDYIAESIGPAGLPRLKSQHQVVDAVNRSGLGSPEASQAEGAQRVVIENYGALAQAYGSEAEALETFISRLLSAQYLSLHGLKALCRP